MAIIVIAVTYTASYVKEFVNEVIDSPSSLEDRQPSMNAELNRVVVETNQNNQDETLLHCRIGTICGRTICG